MRPVDCVPECPAATQNSWQHYRIVANFGGTKCPRICNFQNFVETIFVDAVNVTLNVIITRKFSRTKVLRLEVDPQKTQIWRHTV